MSVAPIKVLIVDDEPFARRYIRKLLADEPNVEVVGEAGSGKAALRAIAKSEPDLMFLDIQMPEMDGFTMLQHIAPADLPVIVFTTAYEEFAVRAFEVHAVDYLLKPFDQQRFCQALEHARSLLSERRSRDQESAQIVELLRSIHDKPKYLERLLVKRNGRIVFVKIDKVDWIKADDKYIHLFGENIRHMIRQTLSSIAAQLDPKQFVQINRSVIVNIDAIEELHPMFNGDHEVQMRGGRKFILSRNHRGKLFDILGRPMS